MDDLYCFLHGDFSAQLSSLLQFSELRALGTKEYNHGFFIRWFLSFFNAYIMFNLKRRLADQKTDIGELFISLHAKQ